MKRENQFLVKILLPVFFILMASAAIAYQTYFKVEENGRTQRIDRAQAMQEDSLLVYHFEQQTDEVLYREYIRNDRVIWREFYQNFDFDILSRKEDFTHTHHLYLFNYHQGQLYNYFEYVYDPNGYLEKQTIKSIGKEILIIDYQWDEENHFEHHITLNPNYHLDNNTVELRGIQNISSTGGLTVDITILEQFYTEVHLEILMAPYHQLLYSDFIYPIYFEQGYYTLPIEIERFNEEIDPPFNNLYLRIILFNEFKRITILEGWVREYFHEE